MRSHDWASTSLGAVETWPAPLRSSLSILFSATVPMACIWGGDRTFFYNDSCADLWLAGDRPLPLGQSILELNTDRWLPLEEPVGQVFTTAQPLVLESSTENNATYRWSYSPLWDESGQIAGVFVTGTLISEKMTSQALASCEQTATQLKESQKFIEQVAEAAPGILYVYDVIEQRNVYINRQVVDVLGYNEAEIQALGNNLLPKLIHPDDRARVLGHFEELQGADDGKILEIEYRMRRVDGEWRWFQSREVVFTRSATGALQRILGIAQDITERKQTEQALQATEERLQLALHSSPVTIFNQDRNLQYTWIYHPIQHNPEDILGKSDRDILQPADADYITSLKQQVLDTGVGCREEVEVTLYNTQHLFYDLTLEPLRDTDNTIIGITGACVNISDLKRVQRELQESESLKQGILDSSNDCIKVLNLKGQMLYINQGGLYTLEIDDPNQVLNTCWIDFWHGEDYQKAKATLAAAQAGQMGHMQGYCPTAKGAPKWWDVVATPLRDASGQVSKLVVISRDITEQKQAEEALRESDRSLTTLIGNLPGFVYRRLNDAAPTLLFVSEGIQKITDYSADQFLQKTVTWNSLVHPADLDMVRAIAAEHIEDKTPIRLTYRIINAQGAVRWVWDRATPVFSETGDIAFWEGFISDVTDRKEAETALKLSEERYRLLNSTLSAVVWSADAEGAFVTPQTEWQLYTGQTWAEYQQLGWMQALHPDDRARVQEQWRQAKETLTTYTAEGRLWHAASQTYRYFESRGMAIFNSDGSVREWIGNITDVNDRQQAEAALRQSEDRLRMAVESAHLGTWDWNLITNELVWDMGCKAMFGLSADADITIETFFAGLHPDDRPRLEQILQQTLTPDSGGSYSIDYRTVGIEDGIERWISAKGQAYFDPNGVPQRFTGTVLDISDRKQAEQALMESEAIAIAQAEELAALMETTPAAIWIAHDPQCHRMTANRMAYELMGSAPGSSATATPAEGDSLLLFKQFKDGEELLPTDLPMQKAIRTRQEVTDEIEFIFPDGTIRNIYGKAVPLFGSDGDVRGAIAGFADITAIKNIQREREHLLQRERLAREEAEQANRLKDQFLAVLSHELRSPLNPILGWSKLLQTRRFNAQKTAQALETIERNARLQAQLVDDLLDMARILRGKLTLGRRPVRLAFVVEAALETVKTAAEAKAITITLDLDAHVQILGDAARLQQVIWNLLSNAIKFTPAQGQVTVRITAINDQAQITVCDTGIGISPEFLPHLFESFRQEDISITRQHGGLGLGLAIVRQLVEAHGGTITADSPGDGQGATFTVCFPKLADTSDDPALADTPSSPLDLTGIRILLVDDSVDTLDFLSALLTDHNAEVMTAHSGATALEQFKTALPHVLVSDIGMPNMDGYSLIQQVRSLPTDQGGEIPAIALTAYARPDDQQKALDSGYQKYLTKPLDTEKLVQTIGTVL